MIRMPSARFSVGDVVQHKLFDYRGVIVDVDTHFGWKEAKTVLHCYQRADEAQLRKALESRRRVRT